MGDCDTASPTPPPPPPPSPTPPAPTCGGDISGDSGVLESSADKTCKWLIAVSDGFAVQISFGSFDVSIILTDREGVKTKLTL